MATGREHITVAAGQLQAVTLDTPDRAIENIRAAVSRAAESGVDLLVLPECAYPAYLLGSIERYRCSAAMSGTHYLDETATLARSTGLHIVTGFVDDAGAGLGNAAALIDDHGVTVGVHHKSFLWGADHHYFEAGDRLQAFDCRLGRVGLCICAEARAPETIAALAAGGAQLIAMPTCWVDLTAEVGPGRNPQPEYLIPARAAEFGIPFVCANKCGRETDAVAYCGRSMIVDSDGRVVAEAPADEPSVIVADIAVGSGTWHRPPRWCLDRVLSNEAPATVTAPTTGSRPDQVTIAAVPTRLVREDFTSTQRPGLLDRLYDAGVTALVTDMADPATANDLAVRARTLGITVIARSAERRVMYEAFGAFATMVGADAACFAPARALALDGAGMVLAFDPPQDVRLLRARALENRVFLVGVSETAAIIIDPAGRIVERCGSPESRALVASIDLSRAADKVVYPDTHIWTERRPNVYTAAIGRHAPARRPTAQA